MEVRYTKSALKVLRRIQPKKAVSILDKMDEISQDPFKDDNLIIPLEGVENGYRRRFGGWRVLYTVDDEIKVLEVFKIGPRGDVYKW